MEILLVLLVSVLMGAINVASFFIGFIYGKKYSGSGVVAKTQKDVANARELQSLFGYVGGGE